MKGQRMTYNFTVDDVEREVRRLAAERPDYVYHNPDPRPGFECAYVHGDEPGCIVGCALHALGVPLEVVGDLEGDGACGVLSSLLGQNVGYGFVDHVQAYQDSGDSWAAAVARADSHD